MNWDASLSTDMAEVILQHSSPLALGSLAGTCRALRDQVKEIAKTNRKLDRFAVAAAHAGMPADCVATGLMNWYDLNCYRADQPAKALQNFLVTLGRDGKLCTSSFHTSDEPSWLSASGSVGPPRFAIRILGRCSIQSHNRADRRRE